MVRSNKLQLLLAVLCFSIFAQANAFWGIGKKSESKKIEMPSVNLSKNQKRIAAGCLAFSAIVAGLVYFYFFKKKQEKLVEVKKVQDKVAEAPKGKKARK